MEVNERTHSTRFVGFRILEFAEKNILFDCSKLGYFIAFTKMKGK
jgi:hypothetical protein